MAASNQSTPKVCVVQDGARLHYAVPIALQRAGALERVYTDWYAAGTKERLMSAALTPLSRGLVKRMRERFAPDLDARRVISKPSLALQQLKKTQYQSENHFFTMLRQKTGRWIVGRGFGEANGVFGFVRNVDPSILIAARARGLTVVVDQMIAPAAIEHREAAIQEQRFRGWSTEKVTDDRDLAELEQQTWDLADRITCASDYVRDGLIASGVPANKIAVLPYPFDSSSIASTPRDASLPLTVGFVGKIGLRKGVPYVLELAKRFDPAKVRFVLIGPIYLDAATLEQHRGPAEIVGPVPRSLVAKWLTERFDMFLLPSTCEGSAGAVTEAMAAGLPAVVSPNTGAPITHGVEGFIAKYDDLDAMTRHIQALADDADFRRQMGRAGRQRAEQFTLDSYGQQLAQLFAEAR